LRALPTVLWEWSKDGLSYSDMEVDVRRSGCLDAFCPPLPLELVDVGTGDTLLLGTSRSESLVTLGLRYGDCKAFRNSTGMPGRLLPPDEPESNVPDPPELCKLSAGERLYEAPMV
jgi:hypothetical protein